MRNLHLPVFGAFSQDFDGPALGLRVPARVALDRGLKPDVQLHLRGVLLHVVGKLVLRLYSRHRLWSAPARLLHFRFESIPYS